MNTDELHYLVMDKRKNQVIGHCTDPLLYSQNIYSQAEVNHLRFIPVIDHDLIENYDKHFADPAGETYQQALAIKYPLMIRIKVSRSLIYDDPNEWFPGKND